MDNKSKNKVYNIIIIVLILILAAIFISYFLINKDNDKIKDNSNLPKDPSVSEDITLRPNNDVIDDDIVENRFEGLALIDDNRGVPVLYYHSIDPSEENEVILSPDKLRAQLQYIKSSGYTTLTISELNGYILNNTPIPEKSIVITFDDGYKDNYTNAFPILKELNMKATIFVITSVIDDGYYLSKEEIKELSDYGIDIQSHTSKHLHLDTLSFNEQLEELKTSKEVLEGITNKPIISVAYPYGDFNEDTLKASIEAGYSLGFSTNRGFSKPNTSRMALNRIYVSSTYSMDTFKERLKDSDIK